MSLLALFALLAGAATAVSPCVLPVLPVVLAAGTTGGGGRPGGGGPGNTLSLSLAAARAAPTGRDRHGNHALVHVRDRGARLCDRCARTAWRLPAYRRDCSAAAVR